MSNESYFATPDIQTIQESQKEWDEALNRGKNTPPTDDITLGLSEAEWLRTRWMQTKEGQPVPADILFAKTIPLPSVEIHIKMPVENHPKFAMRSKIVIFEDALEKLTPGTEKIVGAMSFGTDIHKKEDWMVLKVNNDNSLVFAMDKKGMEKIKASNNAGLFCDLINRCVCAWYGVQISLLHPTLKYVFEHPHMAPLFTKRAHSNKKRKTGYIRKHKVTMESIEKELFPINATNKTHVYTCPVWWVIGHWHTYHGKKQWVNGYWKGVLKDAKRNLDAGRDRQINTKDICIQR